MANENQPEANKNQSQSTKKPADSGNGDYNASDEASEASTSGKARSNEPQQFPIINVAYEKADNAD